MNYCYGCFEKLTQNRKVCPHCGYVLVSEPEEATHLMPGTILSGRYIIGKAIGYGGFGVTYIGWDRRLEMKVAIKEYLPSEFSTRIPGQSKILIFSGVKKEQFTSGLEKFIDEAKKLSKFQLEDGIVTIFDCITENDTAYIIMEYLDGETLAERLKREKNIPEKEAITLLLPIMKSLSVVHSEGIIHRDISPDNIFITKDGHAKLLDFGAARFATTSHSRSLTVIIKPGYSAEEQYRSRSDQGSHTDVYSIAATLYKMITGETPPDALERRAKIENAKKDILLEPHKITKEISLVAENAILNALNIRIEDRTQTVEQLISNLTSAEPVKRVYGKIKRIDIYRIPLWLKILVPSMLVVFLVFGILIASGILRINSLFKREVVIPDGYTIVPNVEGVLVEEASNQLITNKLNYTSGGNITSEYIDANIIVYQNPEAGKLIPINSVVEITVCRGTGIVKEAQDGIAIVPIFVWSEEQVAVKDFETAGLKTRIEYIFDENVASGQVIRATDENGNEITSGTELAEGTTVILFVSKGAEGFPMPNVVGMNVAEAKAILEQAGLVSIVSYVQNMSITEGTVFEQSIEADVKVTLGTQVEIRVASATPVTNTPVVANPNDTNLSTDLSQSTINSTAPGDSSTSVVNKPSTVNHTDTTDSTTVTSEPNNKPTSTPVATSTPIPTIEPTATPTPSEYTVVFDSRYGEDGCYGQMESRTVKNGDFLEPGFVASAYASVVGRLGYSCDEWECNGIIYNRYELENLVVRCDMMFYPVWEKDPNFPFYTLPPDHPDYEPIYYTVTLDSNGGSECDSIICERLYDDQITSLPTPTRPYYRFGGWLVEDGRIVYGDHGYNIYVYQDMTLTAQWSLKDEWSDWSDWSTTPVSEETDSEGLTITSVETRDSSGIIEYRYRTRIP